jgi:predicted MFS family arabinose efflux permease
MQPRSTLSSVGAYYSGNAGELQGAGPRVELMASEARSQEAVDGTTGWRVTAASSIGVLFGSTAFLTFAVFFKPLADEYGWSREAVSAAFGAMTLGAALVAPFVGLLFDRVGPRWICGPSLLVVSVAFASLAALSSNVWHLYLTFIVIGMAMPGTSAVVYSRAVSSWFDRRRGTALAAMMSSAAVGAIVCPPLADALVRHLGWRAAYFALGMTAMLAGVPTVVRYVELRAASVEGPRADADGSTVGEALWSRTFWVLIGIVFGTTIAVTGTMAHLAALLTDRGLGSTGAALVISVMGVASLAGRVLTGWLLDHFAAIRVSFVLLSIAALGTLLLAGSSSFEAAALAAALVGFGTAGEFDVIPYLLSRYFGLRSLSTLYGLNWTAWGLAGAAGPVLMGRAFDSTGSYGAALVGFGVGTLAAAALTLTLPSYDPVRRATTVAV